MKKKRQNALPKRKVVVVTGGFDPLHVGHVRHFEAAKKLGDYLIVVVNNDNWLRAKKGYVFMPQNERKEIIASLKCVDEVRFTKHPPRPRDMSVCRELREIRPAIFANGGDRFKDNIPEAVLCRELGIETVFNVGRGGKMQSSSMLVKKVASFVAKKNNQVK